MMSIARRKRLDEQPLVLRTTPRERRAKRAEREEIAQMIRADGRAAQKKAWRLRMRSQQKKIMLQLERAMKQMAQIADVMRDEMRSVVRGAQSMQQALRNIGESFPTSETAQ